MKKLLLIVILLIAVISRFYNLGQIPASMSDDEIREVMSSYSIARNGTDVFGQKFPLTFNLDGFAYAPVPIYIGSMFFTVLPLTSQTARFPYALTGVISVGILYLLIKEIFRKSKYKDTIALLAAAGMALSPWHIHISRFSHEGIYPLMFYLLGLWLIFKNTKKSTCQIILSAIFFSLGFYSYAAAKVTYLPLIILAYFFNRKSIPFKGKIFYIAIALFTIVSFGYLAKYQGGAQYSGGQIFILDQAAANEAVNNQRQASHIPLPYRNLMYNKLTYWGRTFIEKYSYAFSVQYLFTDTEAAGLYSVVNRGQLYLIDLPLIVTGILFIFAEYPAIFRLIISLILISPLPSALGVSRPTYTHRSDLMIPWLYILASSGLLYLGSLLRNKTVKYIFYTLIFLIYIYEAGSYFQQYYYSWASTNAQYFSMPTKELIQRIDKFKDHRITILGSNNNLILHYAFYHQINPAKLDLSQTKGSVEINNLIFVYGCNLKYDPMLLSSVNNIYIAPPGCIKNQKPDRQVLEGGQSPVWNIYEIN